MINKQKPTKTSNDYLHVARVKSTSTDVREMISRRHRWFSGRMLACHAGGPGSIPGRCNFIYLFFLLNKFSSFSTGWLDWFVIFGRRSVSNCVTVILLITYEAFVSATSFFDQIRKVESVTQSQRLRPACVLYTTINHFISLLVHIITHLQLV